MLPCWPLLSCWWWAAPLKCNVSWIRRRRLVRADWEHLSLKKLNQFCFRRVQVHVHRSFYRLQELTCLLDVGSEQVPWDSLFGILGQPLTRDSAWKRKIRDAFPKLNSQPETEVPCKPRAESQFLRECRGALRKFFSPISGASGKYRFGTAKETVQFVVAGESLQMELGAKIELS